MASRDAKQPGSQDIAPATTKSSRAAPSKRSRHTKTSKAVPKDLGVCFSITDRSTSLHLAPDRLTVTGSRSFRSIRSSHGPARGTWYWEFIVNGSDRGSHSSAAAAAATSAPQSRSSKRSRVGTPAGAESGQDPSAGAADHATGSLPPPAEGSLTGHVRVGISSELAGCHGPVGSCHNSYGLRCVNGARVHCGVRRHYAHTALVDGDVVGVLLQLPAQGLVPRASDPRVDRDMSALGALVSTASEKQHEQPAVPAHAWMFAYSAFGRAAELRGINLSGAEFGPYSSLVPVAADILSFGIAGMNMARIPFKWEVAQPRFGEELDAAYISQLTSITEALLQDGYWVLLDLHNYMRYNNTIVDAKAMTDIWQRLTTPAPSAPNSTFYHVASTYSGAGTNGRGWTKPSVMFDIMNEPNTMLSSVAVANLNAGIAAIRANGLTNPVFVEGNGWSGLHSWMAAKAPNPPDSVSMLAIVDPGNNTVINVHQYLDADSSGQHPQCIDPGTIQAALNWTAFTGWLQEHRLQAYLSEFGSADNANCRAAIDTLLGLVESAAWSKEKGWGFVGFSAWSAGHAWGSKYLLGLNPGDQAAAMMVPTYAPHLTPQCDGFLVGFNHTPPSITTGFSVQIHNPDWSQKATLASSPDQNTTPRLACVPAAIGSTGGIALYDHSGAQTLCPQTVTSVQSLVDLAECK